MAPSEPRRPGDASDLRRFIRSTRPELVKLHLGCGGVAWRDFINIDLHPADPGASDSSRGGCVADFLADMTELDLPNRSIGEIFTAHTIEHFTRWQTRDMLCDWHRMLIHGGRLCIETPDFWCCVLWLFHVRPAKRQLARTMFYGNQWDRLDYETHRYLFSLKELRSLLEEIGFRVIEASHRTETHYPGRDMRIVAEKTAD